MRRILNTTTNTIHKPSDPSNAERTRCGSLRHVPPARRRVISVDEADEADAAVTTRCGSCFEDAGGY